MHSWSHLHSNMAEKDKKEDKNNTEGKTYTLCKGSCKWNNRHLSRFLDDTTINGITYVFRGKSKIRRILWGLIFVGCIIACIILISLNINRFSKKPTATTISVVSVQEEGLPFPAVTICELNAKRNVSNPISNRTYQLRYDLFSPDRTFSQSGFSVSSAINRCHDVRKESELSPFLDIEIWKYLLSVENISKLIHYCGFSIGPNNATVDCINDFVPVLTPAGLCYTFNGITSGKPDQILRHTGVNYGLKVILNVDQETSPGSDGNSGIKVIVHERNDISRPNLNAVGIPTGRNALIGVVKHADIDETVQAHCIHDSDLPFFPHFEYSQFACRQNALMEHVSQSDVCGCVIHSDVTPSGPYGNVRNCTFNDSCCLIKEYASFRAGEKCPLPCAFNYYDYFYSYVSFPTGPYLEELATSLNKSKESVKEDFLSFQIFIEDLRVTTSITQYTYDEVALLSDIGGVTGLFLGISIISCCEIIILILDELKMLCCPKKIKQRIEDIEGQIALPDIVDDEDNEQDIEAA